MSGGFLRDNLWIKLIPSLYTPAQVLAYLERIGWDAGLSENYIQAKRFPRSADILAKLVLRHLLTFPWDNTAMHYTADHHMDVSAPGVYKSLMHEGRGSYCFGQNTFLLNVLRGLGYRVYAGAARVNNNWTKADQPPAFLSQTHMVLFVQPDDDSNRTFVVDVGFGGGGSIRPIPLVAGDESIVQGVGPTEMHRLTKCAMPQSALATSLDESAQPGQELWALQVWTGTKYEIGNHIRGPWRIAYTFSELEFFPQDVTDGSFVVDKSTSGIFASQVLCVKLFQNEEGKLYRKTMSGNEVKEQVEWELRVVRTLHSESDRLKALREVFGVRYDDDAAKHIEGRIPAFPN